MKEKLNNIRSNNELNDIMKNICDNYCGELDNYMMEIDEKLRTYVSTEIPTTQLEDYILNITSVLYFTISGLEEVGIKEDMCRTIRTQLYAKNYANTEGKVADRQTQALSATSEDDLVLAIYSRSYKRLKQKVEAGQEMLNSLKKVVSARMLDTELSNSRYNGKVGD